MISAAAHTWHRFRLWLQGPSDAIVPLYHDVNPSPTSSLTDGDIHNVAPEIFRAQLSELNSRYSIVPLEELVSRLSRGRSLKSLAAVTFDDGYRSVLSHAAPILEELRIPATFFVTTSILRGCVFWRDKVRYVINEGLVDGFLDFARKRDGSFHRLDRARFYAQTKDPNLVSSRAVDSLLSAFLKDSGYDLTDAARGLYCSRVDLTRSPYEYLTFGNHTRNHYVMSSLTESEQHEEISKAEETLRSIVDRVSPIFSVPFGSERDFNRATLDVLHTRGYTGYVLSTGHRVAAAESFRSVQRGSIPAIYRFMPRATGPLISASAAPR